VFVVVCHLMYLVRSVIACPSSYYGLDHHLPLEVGLLSIFLAQHHLPPFIWSPPRGDRVVLSSLELCFTHFSSFLTCLSGHPTLFSPIHWPLDHLPAPSYSPCHSPSHSGPFPPVAVHLCHLVLIFAFLRSLSCIRISSDHRRFTRVPTVLSRAFDRAPTRRIWLSGCRDIRCLVLGVIFAFFHRSVSHSFPVRSPLFHLRLARLLEGFR